MAGSSFFRFEDSAFINGGSMDENGRGQIIKRIIYEIAENTAENRRIAIIELEKLVPKRGVCMVEDVRYTVKSARWDCFDWKNNSTKFYIDVTYTRTSDTEAASAPWKLAPFAISIDTVEREVPFRRACDKYGKRVIPVVNSAGDPLAATTTEAIQQYSFSYYLDRIYNRDFVEELSNTTNEGAVRILGKQFKHNTLLMSKLAALPLVTYEDDGYTPKWTYWQINATVRYCRYGWSRVLLDVGNRARFGNNKSPELIFQYNTFDTNNGTFSTGKVWTDALTYHAANRTYQAWLKSHPGDAAGKPANLPYEYGENIPLTSAGKVNTTVLNQDIASSDFSGYPERTYIEYPPKSWRSLDLPEMLSHAWR